MRRLLAAVSALACLGVLTVAAVAPAEAREPAASTDKKSPRARYQHQAFVATNKHRVAVSLPELTPQDCVQRFAVRQAKAMARQQRMYHQDLGPVLTECKLLVAGENVAYGYPTGRSVVNEGWMKSEGHRLNILSPVYRRMGIAARKGDDGNWYVAQVFGTLL